MTRPCARCGATLPAGVLAGHCPRCLLEVSLDPAPEAGSDGKVPELMPGPFGDYELLEEIARGGMGVVYRARQVSLNRVVALKMILSGPFAGRAAVERFRSEAQAAAGLQHPNIVAIHEVGETGGQPYFTMDLVEGRNLADEVREGPLPPRQAARYLERIARAIDFAHGRGVLHRDLKPSNVLIDLFDEPRVTDFGLAKRLADDSTLTHTGQMVGSPGYMAPEQAAPRRGAAGVGVPSDVYSLGALLYHLLTGRPPFAAATVAETLQQALENDPLPPRALNPAAPPDLETLCLKCLEKEPSRRYPTALAVAEELARFQRGEPIQARPVGRIEKAWRWCRRNPVVAALGTAVAALLIALAAGSSLAAWRIDRALHSENRQREQATRANAQLAAANARLSETVTFLELQRAEAFFRSGDAAIGLAHLAGVLRRDPSNRVAAERIVSALVRRDWILPEGSALHHPSFVLGVAFSPSGRQVVSACADGFARVWDTQSRKEVCPPLTHPATVRRACFSPDEQSVATACEDGRVRIWDWRRGELKIGSMSHQGWAFCVAYSPDGEQLVSGGDDRVARVWSARSGKLWLTLAGHTGPVRQAAFSPDGHWIATAGFDGTARLWNSRTGEAGPVLSHGPEALPILGVAFSPDGARLATSSRDRTARVWDLAGGEPVLPPILHPDGLNDVLFDRTGRVLVTTAVDSTVRFWDADQGTLLSQPVRHLEQVNQAALSPDGRTLATASEDKTVRFWQKGPVSLREAVLPHSETVGWAEFSRDGRWVATASHDRTARVWDGQTGLPVTGPLTHSGPVQSACFSPDDRFLATATLDGSAWIWEVSSGRRVHGPFAHTAALWMAAFSPDGRRLATASADGTARVWDIASQRPVAPPLHHSGDVLLARFSPDGARLVTASYDHTARVWDSATGRPVTGFLAHLDEVRDARFSPDGRRVVTASKDNTARVWSASTGEPIGEPLRHLRTVEAVGFSPDGTRIVTASLDHSARVWEAATGRPLSPLLEHGDGVISACFSPRGDRVLTASLDRTARLWDARTGVPLSEPLAHPARLTVAQFSPDDDRVVTGTEAPDGVARIWSAPAAAPTVPGWLPDLAEAVAGLAVEAQGTTLAAPDDAYSRILARLRWLPAEDMFGRVAQRFAADRKAGPLPPVPAAPRRSVVAGQ